MRTADLFHRELDKAEAFRLLSACYQPPEPEMGSMLQALENLMPRACPAALDMVSEMRAFFEGACDVESLRVEFAALFLGPFRAAAPPYGSVYLEDGRSIMGESTLDVLSRYKQEGLDVSEGFHDAPDHISAELEFVYFLILKGIEASGETGAGAPPDLYVDKRRRFLADHLGAWIPDFGRHVEENARTTFYTSLVQATKALVGTDMEALSGRPRPIERGQAMEPVRRLP